MIDTFGIPEALVLIMASSIANSCNLPVAGALVGCAGGVVVSRIVKKAILPQRPAQQLLKPLEGLRTFKNLVPVQQRLAHRTAFLAATILCIALPVMGILLGAGLGVWVGSQMEDSEDNFVQDSNLATML